MTCGEDPREKREAERINKMIADLPKSDRSCKVWSNARLVTGRLVEIDRANHLVRIRHKDESEKEWVTESFRTPDSWDLFDYDAIKVALGQEIELVTEDNSVLEWRP